MTDVNITQNTNQQDQTPKKTFFGGEVNFQDNNTFETLDQGPTEFSQLQTETTNENTAQLTQLQEDIQETDLEDFDPFEEDNKEEDNKEKDDENNGVINKEEDSKEKDNKNNSVINKEEDNKEKDDKNNGVINKEENKNGPVNHPKDNEETHPENEKEIPLDTPSPKKEVVEEEFEETPEEYEQEPEIKTTGDEVIDKFLQLSHTAREIFQLAEDKSHFKILGGKSPKSTLEYFIYLVEDEEDHSDLFIKKVETNHENNDEEEHLLQRSYHRQLQKLNIFVDEIILYELDTQVETEENKRKQIGEKLNKFGFLFDTYYQDLYKTHQEQQEAQEKKKQLHEIFRSF